jgi:hypothetical protein
MCPSTKIQSVLNRTEPRTLAQWIRYLAVAVIALFLVWWMLPLRKPLDLASQADLDPANFESLDPLS